MSKVRVGSLCNILNGFAFKSANYVTDGIRIIRIANVQKGCIVDDAPEYYPLSSKELISNYMLCDGDLLISLTGNVGRVGILTSDLLPAALNQRVACVRIKDTTKLDKRYLYYLFNDNHFENQCILSSKGIAQKNMSTEWLKRYEVLLPSIEHQRQIITVLDKASELISLRKKQLEELDALAESVFYDMFGDPVKNEKGWEIVKMKECVHEITNGVSPICESRTKRDDEYGVLKLSAVTYGCFNEKENKALPKKVSFQQKIEVCKNDLLMTRKNTFELVGMSAYVFSTISGLMLPDIIFRINTKRNIEKIYLWKLINNPFFRNKIKILATGAAASMPNISKARLINLDLPLPPLSLQTRFAAIIEKIEQQKTLARKALQESEDLFQRLMQDLFKPD